VDARLEKGSIMFHIGDIVKAITIADNTLHYLVLDDTQELRYSLLCLESGRTGDRLKSWLDYFGDKVA
jgi:hypothetical protein